jgi:hypothetical protein
MRTAMALGLMLLIAAPVAAARRSVDCQGGGQFLSIQDAVNASSTGDTIVVAPCVYNEQVVIPNGVRLTIQGSGADVTEVVWSGSLWSDATVRFGSSGLTVRSIKIRHEPETSYAILWDDHDLSLSDCVVRGCSGGGMYYGCVNVANCDIWPSLGVGGGSRVSTVRDSRIGHFGCGGVPLQAGHGLSSCNSFYGSLSFGDLAGAQCVGDSIGSVSLLGGPDSYNWLSAEDCRIGHVEAAYGPEVELHGCTVGSIAFDYDPYSCGVPSLDMLECLVTADVVVAEWGKSGGATGSRSRQSDFSWQLQMYHNTVLGVLSAQCPSASGTDVRSNIVIGETSIVTGAGTTIQRNDFAGGAVISVGGGTNAENMQADPRFCTPAKGDYSLQTCSPCVGAAHDGGDIGAFGVGCPCWTSVERVSWGGIKALFRQPSN